MFNEGIAAAELPDASWKHDVGLLIVDEEPVLLAIYQAADGGSDRHGRIVAWVLALPRDDAILMPTDMSTSHPVLTTMTSVHRRWTRLLDGVLVQVTATRQPPTGLTEAA